jgi:hypothetical protein
MVVDGVQALRTLRVTTPHFVFAAIGVGEITSTTRHDGLNAVKYFVNTLFKGLWLNAPLCYP